jgi:hypothetical protein
MGVVTHVDDTALLGRLFLHQPFAYFNATASQRAHYVALIARNGRAKLIFRDVIGDLHEIFRPIGSRSSAIPRA